jgi:PST family polysaccharide transporter
MPLIDVMGWQLLGDVLKIGSWVLAYTMVSHARTRAFVVTEVCFAGLLCGLTLWFSAMWGLRGTALAYCATYATYWIVMAILFKDLARRLSDVPATTAEAGLAT